jgi:CRP-like cAMP-binding protein
MQRRLAESILFSGINPDDMKIIEQAAHFLTVETGTFLFFQDDSADRFYVVLSGKVKVFKNAPDGKEQILLMAGAGDSFGEAALFARGKYPAAAEVVEGGELASFTYERFMALIRDNPSLAVNMIARLSMLLHHVTRLVQHLSLEDVTTRLAGYIADLLPDPKSAREQHVVLAEKKMVMASILGTIPETLSRAFAKLSKSGIISVDGQEITIHDPRRLAEIAAGEKI